MNVSKLLYLLAVLVLVSCGAADITKDELYEGFKLPAKREFPLSESIRPCDNFYQYVCSETINNYELPANRSLHSFSFSDNSERLLHAKQSFLSFLTSSEATNERRQELKDFYLACIDNEAARIEEEQFVKAEIERNESIQTRNEFFDLLNRRIASPETHLSIQPIPNQSDPRMNDVTFFSFALTLPDKRYYKKTEVIKDLKSLAVAFYTAVELDKAEQKAKWLLEFEKLMANSTPLPAKVRVRITEDRYKERRDFIKAYPQMGLESLFSFLPEQTQIRDLFPESMKQLNQIFKTWSVEKLKSIYLYYQLRQILDDAYPVFFAQWFDFQRKHLGGPQVRSVRQERCTKKVMRTFAKELDAELVPILFGDFNEAPVRELAESVRNSVISGLKNNTWLSEQGRNAAILKMQKAGLYVVQPKTKEQWDFNPKLDYDPKRPIENGRRLAIAQIQKLLKELAHPRNRERWEMGPLTLNAYYMPMDNTFTLLQGILQPPIYDAESPRHVNMGSIGAVVGHELGHGIDDSGAQYDAYGKVARWLSDSDVKEFKRRAELFVKQFDKIGHDGKLTLGENIGDHVGLFFAYDAAFTREVPTAQQQQEFFTQYARTWCRIIRPKFREMLLKTDPHSMGDARTNAQVVHHPAFYEAFSCQPGDAMYLEPKDRIKIW